MIIENTLCANKKQNLLRKTVSFEDRKTFTEVILLSITAKYFIPFTLVPHTYLAQKLPENHEVLTSLPMSPSTASYELNYGFSPHKSLNIKEDFIFFYKRS